MAFDPFKSLIKPELLPALDFVSNIGLWSILKALKLWHTPSNKPASPMIKEKSIFHGVPPRQVLPVSQVMQPLLSGPAWLVTLDDLHYRKVSQTLRT